MKKNYLDVVYNELDKPYTAYPKKLATHLSNKYNIKKNTNLLELGCGRGEFLKGFSDLGINCYGVDLSDFAKKVCPSANISIVDMASNKLPFEDNSVEACFSHMLYCMALANNDLENLNHEIHRILKPKGINIYTVRHTNDGDFKKGIHIGEDLYENDGFIVHFFSKDKVKSLLKGFENISIDEFEEGGFPRKLYFVVNKKL